MEALRNGAEPANGNGQKNDDRLVQVEVIRQGSPDPATFQLPEGDGLLEEVRRRLELAPEDLLFERDKEEPLTGPVKGRRALRLVASPTRQITVVVNYDHESKERRFPPSQTVFKVLQ